MKKQNLLDDDFLKEIAPKLFGSKIKHDVQAPLGYFESFAERIQQRLDQDKQTPLPLPNKVINMIGYKKLAIAASVAAIIAISSLWTNDTTEPTAALEWDEATIAVASEYLNEQDLYSSLEPGDLELINTSLYSEEEALDYLIENSTLEELGIYESK